ALLFRPYAGKALETKGRQLVYMVGLVIFVISVGSHAFIVTIGLLVIMRIVQGIGWGFPTTATSTTATDLVPPEGLGEGLGYFGPSAYLALSLGPALCLTLVVIISFTRLFLSSAALGFLAFLLSPSIRYEKVEGSAHQAVTV